MTDCIFCKIIRSEIPAKKYYEDDNIIIIADISPQAEKHYLLIPKRHYADITQMTNSDAAILAASLQKLGGLADSLGLSGGFRIVSNKGGDARQSVQHLHVHILGGGMLSDKMG